MRIQLSDLRRAADALFDHLERTGRTEIEVTEDFYWNIPEKHLYSVYSPPPESELTVGQLSDDWNEGLFCPTSTVADSRLGPVWRPREGFPKGG